MTLEPYLKEIEERCEKATEGPWKGLHLGHKSFEIMSLHGPICGRVPKIPKANGDEDADRDFISNCRTDLPKLVKMVRMAVEALRYYLDDIIYDPELTELSDGTKITPHHWTWKAHQALAELEEMAK